MGDKELLFGLSGIAARFRVSRGTVRTWYAMGAPIIRLGERTYRAFYENVAAWLESQALLWYGFTKKKGADHGQNSIP